MKRYLTTFEDWTFSMVLFFTLWTEIYFRFVDMMPVNFILDSWEMAIVIMICGIILGWMKSENKEHVYFGLAGGVSLFIFCCYVVSNYEGLLIGVWVFVHFMLMLISGISIVGLFRGVGRQPRGV